MEARLGQRIGSFQHKMSEQEQKLHDMQRKKHEEQQMRHYMELIKESDKQENVHRISKMQDYKRQKTLQKIMSDTEKAFRVKYIFENIFDK
jgi:hypothetical protein